MRTEVALASDFSITSEEYSFQLGITARIIEKCNKWHKLGEISQEVATGISSGLDAAFVYDQEQVDQRHLEQSILKKIVLGGEVDRYALNPFSGKQIMYVTSKTPIEQFPNALNTLSEFRQDLSKRREAANGQMAWYSLHWPRYPELFENSKILIRQTSDRIRAALDTNHLYCLKSLIVVHLLDSVAEQPEYVVAILNSQVINFLYSELVGEQDRVFPEVKPVQIVKLPIRAITFAMSLESREKVFKESVDLYEKDNIDQLLELCRHQYPEDVMHDILVHLTKNMFDLHEKVNYEVRRFLGWLENKLRIKPDKQGRTGVDSLSGTTGRAFTDYLGDYQKDQGHYEFGRQQPAGENFYHYLNKNRTRYAVALAQVDGEIQREYEKSLETLIPIKRDLARTDALIDKIVYWLYRLTDAEIELIERPQYEQALTDAKAQVLADEKLKNDPDAAFEYLSEKLEPAAVRFNDVAPSEVARAALAKSLTTWNTLPERVQTLLLQAERDYLDTRRIDYTGSQINYAKAVEVTLKERLFDSFRDAGYTDADVVNEKAFKPFMRGELKLTLGNFPFLFSSKERVFRSFINTLYPDADERVFGKNGIGSRLTSEQIHARNSGAHEEVISHEDAEKARTWAIGILRMV